MAVTIEAFRPVVKQTLRGFVRVRFDSGLVIDEISVHVGSDDGRAWCSPPARPMLDADGYVIRDPKTGKPRYAGLIAFSTNVVRQNWQRQILDALEAKHPDALKGIASKAA